MKNNFCRKLLKNKKILFAKKDKALGAKNMQIFFVYYSFLFYFFFEFFESKKALNTQSILTFAHQAKFLLFKLTYYKLLSHNKATRLLYSLEMRRKIKNFQLIFLDTGKTF